MASKQLVIEPSEGVFKRWMEELRFTWLGVLLFAVAPAAFFGSGIFSVGVLAVAVLIVLPYAILGSVRKGSQSRGFRRLAVMLVVPALTLAYVSEVDEQIPGNATPVAKAIEAFRRDTGHYPESLEALMPEHLAELPDVRFTVIQPQTNYRVTNGKAYFAIPSALGDMFAQFEYNFETRVWMHHS